MRFPCLCLVEKKDMSHFALTLNHYTLLSSHQSISFFSQVCLSVSESITLRSPLCIVQNISMWSRAHLSEPDRCLSNSSASSAPLKVRHKKGQQTLAWFKAPHLAYAYSNAFFYISLHSMYSTLTLAASPNISMLQHLYDIRATQHLCLVGNES